MIEYRYEKEFTCEELKCLFLSVGWPSGNFPDRLQKGLRNSSLVISARDGDRLVGLIRGLDDGETVGLIQHLLVDPEYQGRHIGYELLSRLMEKYKNLFHVKVMPSNPKYVSFYEQFGFQKYTYTALDRKNI